MRHFSLIKISTLKYFENLFQVLQVQDTKLLNLTEIIILLEWIQLLQQRQLCRDAIVYIKECTEFEVVILTWMDIVEGV